MLFYSYYIILQILFPINQQIDHNIFSGMESCFAFTCGKPFFIQCAAYFSGNRNPDKTVQSKYNIILYAIQQDMQNKSWQ